MKETDLIIQNILRPEEDFKGYTLEEIRKRRDKLSKEIESTKENIVVSFFLIQKSNPLSPTQAATSLPGKLGAVALKLLKGLNYLDYAVLGFSLFNGIKKFSGFFRRKKKK